MRMADHEGLGMPVKDHCPIHKSWEPLFLEGYHPILEIFCEICQFTPALHKSTWELREMPYISAQYRAIVMLHRNSLLVGSRSRPLKNGAFQKNWN